MELFEGIRTLTPKQIKDYLGRGVSLVSGIQILHWDEDNSAYDFEADGALDCRIAEPYDLVSPYLLCLNAFVREGDSWCVDGRYLIPIKRELVWEMSPVEDGVEVYIDYGGSLCPSFDLFFPSTYHRREDLYREIRAQICYALDRVKYGI